MEGHHIPHLSDDHLKKPGKHTSITMGISFYHHGYSSTRYYTTDLEKPVAKGLKAFSGVHTRAVFEVTLRSASAQPILEHF